MALRDLICDFVIAARSLVARPLLATGVTLTLALGIGATATIYSVVDGVMLRQLPYDAPSRLVTVGTVAPLAAFVAPGVQDLGAVSALYYREIQRRARSFDTVRSTPEQHSWLRWCERSCPQRRWSRHLEQSRGVSCPAGSRMSA